MTNILQQCRDNFMISMTFTWDSSFQRNSVIHKVLLKTIHWRTTLWSGIQWGMPLLGVPDTITVSKHHRNPQFKHAQLVYRLKLDKRLKSFQKQNQLDERWFYMINITNKNSRLITGPINYTYRAQLNV